MINMLVVDDEPLVLLTIKSLCRWEDFGISITGEANNGKAALELLRANPDTDIVVVDVDMPVMNGIEFAEALQRETSAPALIFLSSYSNFEYVRSAFKSGACEYLLKSELDWRTLLELINRVARERPRSAHERQRDLSEEARAAFFPGIANKRDTGLDSLFVQSAFTVQWPFYFAILRPGDLLLVHQRHENKLYNFQKTVTDLLSRYVPRSRGDCGSLSYDQYYIFMKSEGELETAFEMFYRAAWTYIDTGFEKKSGGPAACLDDFCDQFSRCLAGFLPPSRLV
ncbi:MAG: response regulator, partial [Treponema sp.]|nr:response regulator [Treponema sp.]